ncbi:unnamed protein product [Effrenium voratum]|uniref:J domain-containing protein n=1 Tax=Effrenium voratum TaxID=2562239 RepID=A0AA36MX09_9DINO|nr:unnamed protein product [Effrenium voratum]
MHVLALDDLSGGFMSNVPAGVTFIQGDIRDAIFLDQIFQQHRVDFVYHLAAYAAEGLSHFIRSYNYRTNLVGSVEILNQAIKHRVQCFVFTSSIAVYGSINDLSQMQNPKRYLSRPKKGGLREEDRPSPEDPYGIAKFAFELDLQAAHEPHNVYGPHQNMFDKYRNVVGIFINQIFHGQPLTIFGSGEQVRAFSYIDDVAPIIARGPLVPRARNQIFNVGADMPHTVNELAAAVAEAAESAGHARDWQPARLEVEVAVSNHDKVKEYFEVNSSISLKEGLQRTVAWYRRQGRHFRPVEFSSVEVMQQLPPSWRRADLEETAVCRGSRVEHPELAEELPAEAPAPVRGLIWALRPVGESLGRGLVQGKTLLPEFLDRPYFIDWLQRRQRPELRLFTQLLVALPDSSLMDLTERDLLVAASSATLVSTPLDQRSRLYAYAAENELPLPLAFSGLRCPCPPEEDGDGFVSQVDRGVTVHWEAFEALLALPSDRPLLLSLGAQGCAQGGKSSLLRELLGLEAQVVEAPAVRSGPCRSPCHAPGVDLLRKANLWTADVHGCSLGDPTWMALIATFASISGLTLLHVSPEDFLQVEEEKPKKVDPRLTASRRGSASKDSVSSVNSNSSRLSAKPDLMSLLKILSDARLAGVGPQRSRILVVLRDVSSSSQTAAMQSYLEGIPGASVVTLERLQGLPTPLRQRPLLRLREKLQQELYLGEAMKEVDLNPVARHPQGEFSSENTFARPPLSSGFDHLETKHHHGLMADASAGAIVVHEDALDAACQVASRSIDQLIWHAPHELAKAVTLFGPGVVVLPMLGRVSGIGVQQSLEYGSHPKRAARGGLMDRLDLELKFGPIDPGRLMRELVAGRVGMEQRLRGLGNDELREEVLALQDWREKASGRLKTMERRAAWAFLGVAGEGAASQAEIKKAFKRRALELHPDKGGDAERFRLLQEMRDLLVEPKSHELEGKDQSKDKDKDKAEGDKEEQEEEEEEEFSEDSWDADEEFRKMFPKRKKKKRQRDEEEAEVAKSEDFHRGKFEAARRKLHRQLGEMWIRATQLAKEIERSQTVSSGDAMHQLRKFLDRFAVTEVSKLKDNDPKKAERIFRRFLEQGSELLCAAGAVDPASAVSLVAMQVNFPLLQAAPSEELKERCNALLQVIQDLPSIGQEVTALEAESFHIQLLVPTDPELQASEPRLQELWLPGSATLGDLRNAASVCGGSARLFLRGKFLGGDSATPLGSLGLDGPLQCLPSNVALKGPRKPPGAGAAAAAAAPPAPAAAAAAEPSSEALRAERSDLKAKPAESAAEVKEVKETKVKEENKENEDAWFDDFFAKPEPEKENPRRAAQEQGKNAMQARLKAQKQAADAKRRLESERPRAARERGREREDLRPQPAQPARPEPATSSALVVSKEEPCSELQRSRDGWDQSWQHPCAGAKRSDGTAIFCGPCDAWVHVSRFDHHDFEIHCDKVGHFGWID